MQSIHLSLVIIQIFPIDILIHVLMEAFLAICQWIIGKRERMKHAYNAVKFVIHVQRAYVAILSRDPDADVLAAKTVHHFLLDTDVFIWPKSTSSLQQFNRIIVDGTIEEIMPCLVDRGTWPS